MGVAVLYDVMDCKPSSAWACGVVSRHGVKPVRVVRVEAMPRNDTEGGALQFAGVVGKGAGDEGGELGGRMWGGEGMKFSDFVAWTRDRDVMRPLVKHACGGGGCGRGSERHKSS